MARLLVLILSFVPILFVGRYIAVHGQPVPYWDEWIEPFDNAVKTAEGRIALSDLIQQYTDSRPLFTNLLTVASVLLTDWNLKAEMYFNVVLAGCTLLLLLAIYRRQHGENAALAVLPFSMLIFSLAQHTSWRWAIQSQYFFLVLFVALGLWSLEKGGSKWPSLCLAAFFSLCATFSYANGFLVWFVIVPVLWKLDYRRAGYFLFWLMATSAALGSFFYGYRLQVIGEGFLLEPLPLLQFTAAFLGNALTASRAPWDYGHFLGIACIGGAGLLLFLSNLLYLRRLWPASKLVAWMALAGFVVASGLLAGLGRGSHFGLEGSLAGRYTTLSSVFWVAFGSLPRGPARSAARLRLLINRILGIPRNSLLTGNYRKNGTLLGLRPPS